MCGISGYIGRKNLKEGNEIIDQIIKYQFHRGPDFQNKYSDSKSQYTIVLGHNRLSILDLSPNSHQPFKDEDCNNILVYNGEIYNYKEIRDELKSKGITFNTQGDTEVLLKAVKFWGIDAINKFNGMFAFCLYTPKTKRLLIVRDRYGIKPLYYHYSDDELVFASSVKVLAKIKKCKPDLTYLSKCLAYGIPETNDGLSPFSNIFQIKPGGYLDVSFDRNYLEIKEGFYYNLRNQVTEKIAFLDSKSPIEIEEELVNILNSSVSLRLRSDVPVGLSLSGGFDSISIGSIACQNNSNIVGFHYGDPLKRETEGPLVKEFQDNQKIKVHYIWPQKDEIIDAFDKTVFAQEAPFTSFSIIAQQLVYKKAKEESIKVLLGGQGGDEVFMGYRKYQLFYLQKLLYNRNLVKFGYNLPGFLLMLISESAKLKLYFDQRHRYNKAGQEYNIKFPLPEKVELNIDQTKPLWERQVIDVNVSSLPSLLRYEDRNSMFNSIESRLPFMDYRLVELGLALPEKFKLKNGFGKWILRDIMKGRIPEKIRINREKRGFDGQNHWIRMGIGHKIRNELKNRQDIIGKFLPPKIDIDTYFNDNEMTFPNLRLREFLILYWLSLELDNTNN